MRGLAPVVAIVLALLVQHDAQADPRLDVCSFPLTIDADGKVTSVTLADEDSSTCELDPALEAAIRSWKFVPATIDGSPTSAETTLTLQWSSNPPSDMPWDYHGVISISSAITGAGKSSTPEPEYPPQELKQGIEARLGLILTIDNRGRIKHFKVEKTATNGKPSDVDRFVAAVRAASWHFQPEVVGGHPIPDTLRVPVSFCTEEHCKGLPRDSSAVVAASAVNAHYRLARLLTKVVGLKLRDIHIFTKHAIL